MKVCFSFYKLLLFVIVGQLCLVSVAQQRDINDIQLTLKKFTEIQKKVDSNAEKIAELENRQKSELELNKEKIKGR